MEKKRVIVAGHACLDLTPVFPGSAPVPRLEEVLSPGKLVTMEGINIHTGGAVSNTGLAMKRLGADVRLIAKIGADDFGRLIETIYTADGAAGDLVRSPEGRTSYSVVLAPPGLDRIFLHDPGCNDTFCASDVSDGALEGAALLHFGYPPLMKRMYENGGEELLTLLMRAKLLGVATSLDLAAVDESSAAAQAPWERILARVLPYVDFFVPSIEELCRMLDRERYREWQCRAGGGDVADILSPEEDVAPLAARCVGLGAGVVLLKCGAPGLYYKTAAAPGLPSLVGTGWADREGFERSYAPRRVASATGAGDTAIAAFLAAMLEGRPFESCVCLAAAEGASCVEEYDALGGIRTFDRLQEMIDQGWPRSVQK